MDDVTAGAEGVLQNKEEDRIQELAARPYQVYNIFLKGQNVDVDILWECVINKKDVICHNLSESPAKF